MPRIEDFKTKLTDFKRIKYTPWDNSPTSIKDCNNASLVKKPSTINQVQKTFKTGFKPVQNQPILGFEPDSTKFITSFEPGSETGFEPGSKESIKFNITSDKLPVDISLLTGAQRKIFLYIIDSCCSNSSLISSNINTTELSKFLKIPKDTIKTSLRRLQEKFLIKKNISKQGVGGFLRFEISEDVKLLGVEMQKNDLLTVFKSGSEIGSKTGFDPNIVSSSIITTTTDNALPLEWETIDCNSLKQIGFSRSHLIQIHRELLKNPSFMLSAEIIQDSINALAFDLKYNSISNNFKNPPAVVLTSLLKKGQPYSSVTPDKFLSPQAEAMKEYMLAQEQKHAKMLEIEVKTKKFVLQEWLDSLNEEELLSFSDSSYVRPEGMPEKIYQTSKRKKMLENAKEYFDTIMWPKRLKEILNSGI